MIQLPNYDKAIIVSGDGDYHCLIEYLLSLDKLGYLLIPNRYSFSSLLREFSKFTYFVSDLKAKLEFRRN